jgi:hypothetical protein
MRTPLSFRFRNEVENTGISLLRFSRATESWILSGCARRSGIPVFCSRKNRHDKGCFSLGGTVIPDPFGMTEKRDPGSEAGMTLFLRIPIRHQVGRIPQKCLQLSPLSPPEGGGAVKLTEKRDPSRHPCRGVAILDESPFVIPDADPESIQTGFLLIFYVFHGQRRAGISRDAQGVAGYRYFARAKTGMTWAVFPT